MTAEKFAEVVKVATLRAQPCTFAILRDDSRRGGVRVVRCLVVSPWEMFGGATVAEIRRPDRWHVLPLSRLSKTARGVRKRAASLLTFAAPDEKSAAVSPLAGAGAA